MALPSSGTLSIGQIATEFGDATPNFLSADFATYIGKTAGNVISITDFYGASSTTDTGWVVPTYSSNTGTKNGDVTNPTYAFDANTGTASGFSTGSSSAESGYVAGHFPTITTASEILEWGIRVKIFQSSYGTPMGAELSTAIANDSTAAPSIIRFYTGTNGTHDVTWNPTSGNFSASGNISISGSSSNCLGTSAAVLDWWAGGAGFTFKIEDYDASPGGLAYYCSVRVVYS